MQTYELKTPLSEKDVKKLRINDIVYLSGWIYVARDKVHMRVLEYEKKKKKLPFDWKNGVIFHCGPLVEKKNNRWRIVGIGPTTSSRMNKLQPDIIEKYGIRAIIGKGGMNQNAINSMKKNACIYLAMTGGCAASAAKSVKTIEDVRWLDLGTPEALWVLDVERLGPLIVAIDSHGGSIYQKVDSAVKNNLKELIKS